VDGLLEGKQSRQSHAAGRCDDNAPQYRIGAEREDEQRGDRAGDRDVVVDFGFAQLENDHRGGESERQGREAQLPNLWQHRRTDAAHQANDGVRANAGDALALRHVTMLPLPLGPDQEADAERQP
jgi:hypothetical protein